MKNPSGFYFPKFFIDLIFSCISMASENCYASVLQSTDICMIGLHSTIRQYYLFFPQTQHVTPQVFYILGYGAEIGLATPFQDVALLLVCLESSSY